MPSLPTPADHPNTSAALIAGYVAQVIVFGAKKAGVEISPQEAMTASAAAISLVLFFAGKKNHDQPRNASGQFEKK